MDFFEALKKRAWAKFAVDFDGPKLSEPREVSHPIDATIEALKEMRAGKPKRARLCHKGRISATPYTVVEFKPGCQFGIGGLEHIGTDGEEVVVMVFRCEEE